MFLSWNDNKVHYRSVLEKYKYKNLKLIEFKKWSPRCVSNMRPKSLEKELDFQIQRIFSVEAENSKQRVKIMVEENLDQGQPLPPWRNKNVDEPINNLIIGLKPMVIVGRIIGLFPLPIPKLKMESKSLASLFFRFIPVFIC